MIGGPRLGEQILAGLVVATCLVMLLRLVIGPSRRARLDRAGIRAWYWARWKAQSLTRWRRSSKEAARVADEAIRRARGEVERDGNVYRPKDFRDPRKPH